MKSQPAGFITLDFLFALILAMGFGAVLFAITMTLVVVEITQYASFAAARVYHSSHLSANEQRLLADQKFQALTVQHPVFGPFFQNSWFSARLATEPGLVSRLDPQYANDPPEQNTFAGVMVEFTAPVLGFSIPFYGRTTDDEENPNAFRTRIGSYLGREMSVQGCQKFVGARFEAILKLRPSQGPSYSTLTQASQDVYTEIFDNGC